MTDPKPVFIADTCIGGLSVLKSLWESGCAGDALFMADYEVNPLGVKSDAAIADAVNKWFSLAKEQADTLILACNTLSIRYHQLPASRVASSGLQQIVSMVDCYDAMINVEADLLAGKKVLIIGTAFTASQSLYPDMLGEALPGTRVNTVAATELERRIARFLPWEGMEESVLTNELQQALENTDIAILACTCFPMARAELNSRFPDVLLLDPGAYCPGLLAQDATGQQRRLSITVKGDVVSESRVSGFARTYLGNSFTGL